ncbi:MAG TPA: bacillithiol system redox-active protein YtxJ [Balneolaceae bacterium]|nr:bacillithiol system redox-active protein YtxJ [Balneolaceae bacterium]
MGFLSRLKDSFSTDLNVSEHWNQPETENDLDPIFSNNDRLSAIFKHSAACGTSAFALRDMEKILPETAGNVDFYIIEVRAQRKLSDRIAQKTGVRHESPQLILIKNGEALWNASHSAIYPASVVKHIEKFM